MATAIKNKRGQSIVELVLMTPFILITLYVPVDFGVAYLAAHLTQNATREVARIAVAQDTGTYNQSLLQANLNTRIPDNVTIVSGTVTRLTTTPANCMQVVRVVATVRYHYFFYRIMNWFGAGIPPHKDVTRTTIMRYEFQPYSTSNTFCTAA